MAKLKMNQLLTAPDKGAGKTPGINGVLSKLFRQLLLDLNVNPMRWGALMSDFIKDVRNGVPDNRRDQTSIRGNLTKEFARPQMTWKVFMKAMRFLQVSNVKITIEVTHPGREHPTVTSVNVPMGHLTAPKVLEELAEPEIAGESEFEDGEE